MLISHRGNDIHGYKENTKEALLTALEKDYISGVELDVRLTKDNKIVIIHNSFIEFNSDGRGLISKMTLRQLKKYNFGNDKYPCSISTLTEFLKEVNSNKLILIELKDEYNNNELWYRKIKTILKKYQYLNIWLCSFNYKLVFFLKSRLKGVNIGLIVGVVMNKKKDEKIFDFVSYNYRNYKKANKNMAWTINDRKTYLDIKDSCNYIITDKAYLIK